MSYEVLQLALFTNDIERVKPIEKIVSPLGWQLIAAVMQKQPVQWILEQKVELILIDLDMPDSIHLAGSLCRCQPDVPILAVTSAESLDKVHDAITAGAKDFITHPINAKHLMAALHRAIGERSTSVSNIIPIFDDMPDTQVVQSAPIVQNRAPRSNGKTVSATGSMAQNGVSTSTEAVSDVAEIVSPMPVAVKESNGIEDLANGSRRNGFADIDVHRDEAETFVEQIEHDEVSVAAPAVEVMQASAVSNNAVMNSAVSNGKEMSAPQMAVPSQSAPSQSAPNQPMQTADRVATNHRMPQFDTPANTAPQAPSRPAVQPVSPPADNGAMHFQPSAGLTSFQPVAHGKTTAIVSLRGGIGRSTIATNLALSLAQKEMGSVTLVEAHHGLSNLSLMLHLHPQRTLATLQNEHTIDYDIVRGYLQQHTSGVNVLSAPTEIDDMIELAPDTWAHLLNICSGLSVHTIIDTAAAADSALTEVLMKADDILIVTDPDIAGLRSATALYQNVYSEPSISGQLHLVINRNGISGGLDEKTVQKQIGHEALAVLPYDPSLTTYAMNRGIPFVQSHPRSLLSKRINGLAEKLFAPTPMPGQPANAKKPATKSSFMSFLGR